MPLRGLEGKKGAKVRLQTVGVRWIAADDLSDDSDVAVDRAGVFF